MSLERIRHCDVYRAGDGVHRAWLERRAAMGGPFQKLSRVLNRKHSAILALEKSLLAEGGAASRDRKLKNGEGGDRAFLRISGRENRCGAERRARERVPARRRKPGQSRETLGLTERGHRRALCRLRVGTKRFALRDRRDRKKRKASAAFGRGTRAIRENSNRLVFSFSMWSRTCRRFMARRIFFCSRQFTIRFPTPAWKPLAAGLPVVTTRANGFSEIIATGVHGTVLDDPRNIDAICEALLFWSDHARREEARVGIVELAARFDISVQAVGMNRQTSGNSAPGCFELR